MSLVLLIRHGETDHTGTILSGRSPGVHLNERGRRQAAELPHRLGSVVPDLLYASPLERTCETARPLAEHHNLELRTLGDLLELDYGEWRGREPTTLNGEEYWHLYNRHRSTSRIPGGELLVEAQVRMLRALESLHNEAPDGCIAVVGHSDPIKALLGYLLGLPLDFINRLEVAPASISAVSFGRGEPRVHCINLAASLAQVWA